MPDLLTVVDGRLRVNGCGGPLVISESTSDKCCCGCSDPNIQYPCTVTVIHVDENRCEDDVFDVYVVGVGERFIRELDLVSSPPGCCDNYSCPQTRIEFDIQLQRSDFNENCETTIQARYKRANCCSTYTRLTLVASNGAMISGQYFGPGGYSETWEADVLCGATAPPP